MALNRQETTDKVIAIVADVLKIDPKNIALNASFKSLGADSLDMMEMLMKIEDAFNVTIPEEATAHIDTIDQAVDALVSL